MPKMIDLTGQKFERWTVLKRDSSHEKGKGSGARWICECDCGNIKSVGSIDLRRGDSKSCGCLHKEVVSQNSKQKVIDLTGQRFGKLRVLNREGSSNSNQARWLCECDCGNRTLVDGSNLRRGTTQSCGCTKTSLGEVNIMNILQKNTINFCKEFNININGNRRRYDFAIMNDKGRVIRLIEFDGPQHEKSYTGYGYFTKESCDAGRKRDLEKDEYAKVNNIPLVRIPYKERDSITLDLIMGDKYLLDFSIHD